MDTEKLRNQMFKNILGAVVKASGENGIILQKGDKLYRVGLMSFTSPDGEDYDVFFSVGELQEEDYPIFFED